MERRDLAVAKSARGVNFQMQCGAAGSAISEPLLSTENESNFRHWSGPTAQHVRINISLRSQVFLHHVFYSFYSACYAMDKQYVY